jgi:hypothetical protein
LNLWDIDYIVLRYCTPFGDEIPKDVMFRDVMFWEVMFRDVMFKDVMFRDTMSWHLAFI